MRDYYRILQVSRDADPEVIEKAYKVLARKLHPDMRSGVDAHDAMVELNEAYAVLSDPVKRAAYDATLPPSHDAVIEALKVFWDSGLIGLFRRYVR